jgi:hypothetical protein
MINITDNFRVNKPAPIDDRLGPFVSTASALSSIEIDRRHIGLTVIIDDGTGAVEYWFKDGVSNGDLEAKASGGGGSSAWGSITGTLSNQTDLQTALNAKANTSSLATVATSGSYNDLTNKPTIPNAQVNSDWNSTSGVSEILNKPTIPSISGLVPYTGATEDVDLGTHDLYTNKVYLLDEPNDNHASIHYTDGDFHIEDADGHKLLVIEDGFIQLHKTNNIQSNLFTEDLTETRDHRLPNASGTIALTSNITKSAVGLGNVDNTSDANKPISTATQTALDLKAPIASPTFTGTVGGITKSMVGLGSVDNTTDLNKPISTATQNALNLKENTITAGTTSQYYRGDKTFQTLDKTAVGLGNVDNTSDANKAFTAAQITSLVFDKARIPKVIPAVAIAGSAFTSGNTTSEIIMSTLTIPANTLNVGDVVRISGLMTYTTAATKTLRVKFGTTTSGTSMYSPASLASSVTSTQIELLAVVTASTTLRFTTNTVTNNTIYGNGTGALVSQTIDRTQSISFIITVTKTSGADTVTCESAFLEIITS